MENIECPVTIHDQSTKKPSYALNGSFGASPLDFINRSLNHLSDALRLTVTLTYSRLPKLLQKTFYVTEIHSVAADERIHFQKLFGDPSLTVAGGDVKMLLKNLRSHWKMYSNKMNMYDDAFEDVTGFLLHDIVESDIESFHINHIDDGLSKQAKLLDRLVYNHEVAKDVIEASWELVAAIHEAKYYQPISKQINSVKTKLEELFLVIQDFKEIHDVIEADQSCHVDSKKVVKVWNSVPPSPSVSPSNDDSNLVKNDSSVLQSSKKHDNDSAYCSPDNLTPNAEIKDKRKDAGSEDKENIPQVESKGEISPSSGCVEHMSTPVLKNKNLEKVAKSNRKPLSMSPIVNVNNNCTEAMEGSFVVL